MIQQIGPCIIIPNGDRADLINTTTQTKIYKDRIEYRDLYRGMSRPRLPGDKNGQVQTRKGHRWNDVYYRQFTIQQAEAMAKRIWLHNYTPAITTPLTTKDIERWAFLKEMIVEEPL